MENNVALLRKCYKSLTEWRGYRKISVQLKEIAMKKKQGYGGSISIAGITCQGIYTRNKKSVFKTSLRKLRDVLRSLLVVLAYPARLFLKLPGLISRTSSKRTSPAPTKSFTYRVGNTVNDSKRAAGANIMGGVLTGSKAAGAKHKRKLPRYALGMIITVAACTVCFGSVWSMRLADMANFCGACSKNTTPA